MPDAIRRALAGIPVPVRLAAGFLWIHILFQPKIAASQIALSFGVLFGLIAWRKGQLVPVRHPVYAPMLLFFAAAIASGLAAPRPVASVLNVGSTLNFLVYPLALALYVKDPRLKWGGVAALCSMAVFQSLYGFYQYATTGHLGLEYRIRGGATHVMTYSGILLPIALLALVVAIDTRRWWAIATALTTTTAIVLTMTRSAWLGWAAGAFAILVVRKPRWIAILAPVAVLAVTFSPMSIFSRLASTFDPNQSSNLDRIRMTQAGIEIIADHPIFGVGPGNVKETYPLYRLPDAPRFRIPHLHNNIVQIWAEEGVVTLLAYLGMLASLLAWCARALRRGGEASSYAMGGIAALIGVTLAGLFEFNFGDSEVLMNFLDVMAIVTAMTIAPPGDRAATPAPRSQDVPA